MRAAVPDDLPVLDRAIPSGRNDVHAGFLARQAAGEAAYLVAWRGDDPVGYGVVRWAGRHGEPWPEIGNLHVPGSLQGRGAGTALIRHAEGLVRDRGYARVVIAVDEANPRAAALYGRLGYTDVGRPAVPESYTYFDADGIERVATEQIRVLVRDLDPGGGPAAGSG